MGPALLVIGVQYSRMQFFGLIALIIMLVLGVVFVSNKPVTVTPNQDGEVVTTVQKNNEKNNHDTTGVISEGVEVYAGIRVPKNTKTLDLSGRGLTGSLKAEVRLLSEVEEINLSDNQFTGLPAEVGQLSKLRRLNLSNNPFTGLPHELGNLQKLETLNLSGTQYSTQDLQVIQQKLPLTTKIISD